MIRLPEDDAGVSKHVGVLTMYKILFIYIYLCVWGGVHFLVWIINCTRCTVHTSTYVYQELILAVINLYIFVG